MGFTFHGSRASRASMVVAMGRYRSLAYELCSAWGHPISGVLMLMRHGLTDLQVPVGYNPGCSIFSTVLD
jgi:hypothetical protein